MPTPDISCFLITVGPYQLDLPSLHTGPEGSDFRCLLGKMYFQVFLQGHRSPASFTWPNLFIVCTFVSVTPLFVCLIWFFTSQSTIFKLCRDGSSWVEPVLSKDKCVLLKDTTQWRRWGSNPYHWAAPITPLYFYKPSRCCFFARVKVCRKTSA